MMWILDKTFYPTLDSPRRPRYGPIVLSPMEFPMERPLHPNELPIGFIMCLCAGAACQHFTPLPFALAFKATLAVAVAVTTWRIWRGQGARPSILRGLSVAVGWSAGILLANALS